MTPIYEFECVGCHSQKTVEASIFDKIQEPICMFDGCKMYRVYSAPAVQFKAKDFYKTSGG